MNYCERCGRERYRVEDKKGYGFDRQTGGRKHLPDLLRCRSFWCRVFAFVCPLEERVEADGRIVTYQRYGL